MKYRTGEIARENDICYELIWLDNVKYKFELYVIIKIDGELYCHQHIISDETGEIKNVINSKKIIKLIYFNNESDRNILSYLVKIGEWPEDDKMLDSFYVDELLEKNII